jgi:hypothetical protein
MVGSDGHFAVAFRTFPRCHGPASPNPAAPQQRAPGKSRLTDVLARLGALAGRFMPIVRFPAIFAQLPLVAAPSRMEIPMLRASFALLLICASATALAQSGRGVQTNATNCQEIADKALENPLPVESRPKATAVRNKYARPTTAAAALPAPTRGGGGDSDNALPRSRGSKWHSFLPGMFR